MLRVSQHETDTALVGETIFPARGHEGKCGEERAAALES